MELIDRQAAIDAIKCGALSAATVYGRTDAGRAALYETVKAIKALPSAQPKRGKWIFHIDDLFPEESTQECDQCHEEQPLACDSNYCPYCGADMREEGET